MANQKDPWAIFKNTLPSISIAIADAESGDYSDGEYAYDTLLDGLPSDVSEGFNDFSSSQDDGSFAPAIQHSWCLCEMPEGEYPNVRLYSDLSGLLTSIASREGDETAVFALYGVHLEITEATSPADGSEGVRYLLLPQNMAAKVKEGGEAEIISQDDEDLPKSEHLGWLGRSRLTDDTEYFLDDLDEEVS